MCAGGSEEEGAFELQFLALKTFSRDWDFPLNWDDCFFFDGLYGKRKGIIVLYLREALSLMSNRTIDIDDRLYGYLEQFSFREPEVLGKLREETLQMGGIARMQISPEQGQFMGLLVELMNASAMIEVGTFTGYSTLACALAMPSDGKIVACDISDEWTNVGKRYWQEAGVAEKIDLRIGPAAETLRKLLEAGQGSRYDMMFIDADKTGYDTYYELGLKLVRPGGLILIDNVLWGGSVADPKEQDEDTVAIRALNEKIHRDARVTLSMVPIGDGLTLARRRV